MLPALLALPLFFAAQSDERLVDVPKGWKYERLELPPSFAPEIEQHGVEDLSFAPGMFAPHSPSYFSYALALRFDGEVELDEPALVRFLELYYGGLYRAVAEGKPFAKQDAKTSARVERTSTGFRASVSTFDAFTDGRALALTIDLCVHDTPRSTELLGLASPKPLDAPIWAELRALETSWRAARPAPVFLNHVFFVVDAPTYEALSRSSFLRETFAVGEERVTRRLDVSYTGLYLYGRRTYFEFLPRGAAGLETGSTGLALGVDARGALDAFAARLAEQDIDANGGPMTRELDGKQLPWFQILGIEVPAKLLTVFAMEYDPRFLATWHPDLAPAHAGIARADVLERYAASLKRTELRTRAPFADVRTVHVEGDEEQLTRLRAICAAARFDIEEGKDATTCRGPRITLVLRRSKEPAGIVAIELELCEALEREPLQLGKATLSFSGKTATLRVAR